MANTYFLFLLILQVSCGGPGKVGQRPASVLAVRFGAVHLPLTPHCHPQLIPQISSLSWFTTIVPLVLVLTITAVKDATDDYVSAPLSAVSCGLGVDVGPQPPSWLTPPPLPPCPVPP